MSELTAAVIILAGGHSKRMGQDKALLQLPDGQSLLARTYQVAIEIAPQVIVVTPWPERYRGVLPPSATFIQEPAAEESMTSPDQRVTRGSVRQKPSKGPLSGFAYGWQRTTADWCLLLACDMPYLEAAPLRRWWRLLAHEGAHSALSDSSQMERPPMASLVKTGRGWQPLCGFYHRRGLSSLLHYLADPRLVDQQRSFQPWLRTVPVLSYTELPHQLFFNCNTPNDWRTVTSGL